MLKLHKDKYADLTRLLRSGSTSILVLGDLGVGKKTLVKQVILKEFSSYQLIEIDSLNMEGARGLKSASIRSTTQHRIYLINGDNVSVQVYNAILKLLEEPPSSVTYIIVTSVSPVLTIVSRCHNVLVPPLSKDELRAVLEEKGVSERVIVSLLPYAHGSVSTAMQVYEKFEEKRRLIPFIKALKDRDQSFVLSQVKNISRSDINLMVELCDDVLMSRYGLISQDLSAMVPASPDFLFRVKESLMKGSSPALNWLRAWFELKG